MDVVQYSRVLSPCAGKCLLEVRSTICQEGTYTVPRARLRGSHGILIRLR